MSPTSYRTAPPRAKVNLNLPELMVGLGRVELPTSRLSGVRSNQLSYRPVSLPRPFCRKKEPHFSESDSALEEMHSGPCSFGGLYLVQPAIYETCRVCKELKSLIGFETDL